MVSRWRKPSFLKMWHWPAWRFMRNHDKPFLDDDKVEEGNGKERPWQ